MSERFPEKILLRVSRGLTGALAVAATAEHCSRTDYLRRAIVERLRQDGALCQAVVAQLEPQRVQL